MEERPLERFHEEIHNHALCGDILGFYPPLFDLIGGIKMFNVEVACALAGGALAIDFQLLCCLVVLMEVRRTFISLGGNKEFGPNHAMNDVADSN